MNYKSNMRTSIDVEYYKYTITTDEFAYWDWQEAIKQMVLYDQMREYGYYPRIWKPKELPF